MKRLLSIATIMTAALITAQAQVKVTSIKPGKKADSADRVIQKNIKQTVQDHFPDWKFEKPIRE